MPFYEYQCNRCANEFELLQRITEPPGGTCPRCGSEDVRRLISRTSFQLKGAGWYVTDYGGRKNGSAAEHSASKGEKKGETGTGASAKADTASTGDAPKADSGKSAESSASAA